MNKKLILSAALFSLILPSCNKSNHINRESFNSIDFAEAKKNYESMATARKSSFVSKCTTAIRYSMNAKGSARIGDMSFHNLDLNASAGFDISWSLDDQYMKIEGENEVIYYKFIDNKWMRFESYTSSTKHFKYKIDYTDELEEVGGFKNWIIDTVDYYSCLHIIGTFSLGLGLTGSNSYVEELIGINFEPNSFFDEDIHNSFETMKKNYETEKEGYNLSLEYGSNGSNSVSSTIKGKVKSSDIHEEKQMTGYINIDLFTAFKDNFLSQGEYIISGNAGNKKMQNFNTDFNLYLSQEVKQGDCKVDTINPNDYKEPNKDNNNVLWL